MQCLETVVVESRAEPLWLLCSESREPARTEFINNVLASIHARVALRTVMVSVAVIAPIPVNEPGSWPPLSTVTSAPLRPRTSAGTASGKFLSSFGESVSSRIVRRGHCSGRWVGSRRPAAAPCRLRLITSVRRKLATYVVSHPVPFATVVIAKLSGPTLTGET